MHKFTPNTAMKINWVWGWLDALYNTRSRSRYSLWLFRLGESECVSWCNAAWGKQRRFCDYMKYVFFLFIASIYTIVRLYSLLIKYCCVINCFKIYHYKYEQIFPFKNFLTKVIILNIYTKMLININSGKRIAKQVIIFQSVP